MGHLGVDQHAEIAHRLEDPDRLLHVHPAAGKAHHVLIVRPRQGRAQGQPRRGQTS